MTKALSRAARDAPAAADWRGTDAMTPVFRDAPGFAFSMRRAVVLPMIRSIWLAARAAVSDRTGCISAHRAGPRRRAAVKSDDCSAGSGPV